MELECIFLFMSTCSIFCSVLKEHASKVPRQEEGFLQSVMLTGTQCQHHPLHRHVTEMPEPSVTQSADISLISSLVCSLSHSAF